MGNLLTDDASSSLFVLINNVPEFCSSCAISDFTYAGEAIAFASVTNINEVWFQPGVNKLIVDDPVSGFAKSVPVPEHLCVMK